MALLSHRLAARVAPFPEPLDLKLFHQMAELSNDAFYLCDATGRFLYVNQSALKKTGYSKAEMLRMTVSELNPEYPAARFREFTEAMQNGTAITQFETLNRRKDGSIYPIELSVARIDVGKRFYLFGVVRDISERRQIEIAQRTFTQRILQTLEAERQRVARELHDDVGQAIATVGVLLHSLESTPGAVPPEARPALEATHATIRRITESVARLVRDHHPAELLGLGLEDTIRTHAREFARRHALGLRLATTAVAGLLPPEHELHLYRIVQEALSNVARHAAARNITLRLGRERRSVVVAIRDDGVGYTPGAAPGTGLGLVTMRERAEIMGATLLVRPLRGRGTEVRVAVPIVAGRTDQAPQTRAPRRARGRPSTRRAASARRSR